VTGCLPGVCCAVDSSTTEMTQAVHSRECLCEFLRHHARDPCLPDPPPLAMIIRMSNRWVPGSRSGRRPESEVMADGLVGPEELRHGLCASSLRGPAGLPEAISVTWPQRLHVMLAVITQVEGGHSLRSSRSRRTQAHRCKQAGQRRSRCRRTAFSGRARMPGRHSVTGRKRYRRAWPSRMTVPC
jgi:hypothetical protein